MIDCNYSKLYHKMNASHSKISVLLTLDTTRLSNEFYVCIHSKIRIIDNFQITTYISGNYETHYQ